MTFSRDDVAAYEKSTPPAAVVPEPVIAAAENAADASEASSASDVSADPTDSGSDGTPGDTADSPPATAETDSETGEHAGETPRGSRARERIEDLVAERNALRKYGEYMAAKVSELAGTKTAPQAETAPEAVAAADGDEPPTIDKFNYDPVEFSKAQSKWLKAQVQKGVQETLAQERRQQSDREIISKFEERAAEVRKTNPDFDVVVNNPALPKMAPVTAGVIVRSTEGPKIVLHLGKNPDLAARIARLEPDRQIEAIVRLENDLKAKPAAAAAPPRRSVTNAPPPPSPVQGAKGPGKSPSAMSMDEFVAHERAQKLARRKQNVEVRRAMR